MFPTSTQKKNWIFKDELDLNALREEANKKFVTKYGAHMSPDERNTFFLDANEEHIIQKCHEYMLRDFCHKFQPTMPKYVFATALNYLKRFYLYNSVMDYHPKEIMVTCLFLACKVDEFNVSLAQFVANIKGNQSRATTVILNNELFLMEQIKYNLKVHHPFKAIEGFLLDIKTRTRMSDPDRMRTHIDSFIDKLLFTDACLLFAPSQLALAAVLHSASQIKENLDSYVTDLLLGETGSEHLKDLIEVVRRIRILHVRIADDHTKELSRISKKLDKCRNQENNPFSEKYKDRIQEALNNSL